jgi:hypothetical protein
MSPYANSQRVIELERKLFRALFSEPPAHSSSVRDENARAAIVARLLAHRWQDPEHRVVFEALRSLPGRHAAELREQLPAQVTRMGFPDVDWDEYFIEGVHDSSLETLTEELLAASSEDSS